MLSGFVAEDPMVVFLYAVKSPEPQRRYPRRFKMFLDYLGFDGLLKEQAKNFKESEGKSSKVSKQSDTIHILPE